MNLRIYFKGPSYEGPSAMKIINLSFALMLVLTCAENSVAQNCNNPSTLCAEEVPDTNAFLPVPVTVDCFNAAQTYFYEFQTNDNSETESTVDVNVNVVQCPGSTGPDSIFAIVVEHPQGTNPCDPSGWIPTGDCFSDTADFSFSVDNIQANSEYFVIIGTNQPPGIGPCAFSVSVAGEPVDLQATVDPPQVTLGESTQLNVLGGDSNSGYTWTPTDYLDNPAVQDPISFPEQTTSYVVEGTVGDCTVTDVVTVIVGPPVTIFNAFSPNDDGINDTWSIDGIEKFEKCEVKVYDRWGQNMFKSVGYTRPWDGTNNGAKLPMGTYYYVVELNSPDVDIEPLTGAVAVFH